MVSMMFLLCDLRYKDGFLFKIRYCVLGLVIFVVFWFFVGVYEVRNESMVSFSFILWEIYYYYLVSDMFWFSYEDKFGY